MTKRIVSLLMAVVLVIGVFAVSALAAQEDDGIMPHGPMCHCGGDCLVSTTTVYRPISSDATRSCIHGLKGTDELCNKWVITKTTCKSCGDVRTSERNTNETVRVCHGYK